MKKKPRLRGREEDARPVVLQAAPQVREAWARPRWRVAEVGGAYHSHSEVHLAHPVPWEDEACKGSFRPSWAPSCKASS